jgi:hypothetical protein
MQIGARLKYMDALSFMPAVSYLDTGYLLQLDKRIQESPDMAAQALGEASSSTSHSFPIGLFTPKSPYPCDSATLWVFIGVIALLSGVCGYLIVRCLDK